MGPPVNTGSFGNLPKRESLTDRHGIQAIEAPCLSSEHELLTPSGTVNRSYWPRM